MYCKLEMTRAQCVLCQGKKGLLFNDVLYQYEPFENYPSFKLLCCSFTEVMANNCYIFSFWFFGNSKHFKKHLQLFSCKWLGHFCPPHLFLQDTVVYHVVHTGIVLYLYSYSYT